MNGHAETNGDSKVMGENAGTIKLIKIQNAHYLLGNPRNIFQSGFFIRFLTIQTKLVLVVPTIKQYQFVVHN